MRRGDAWRHTRPSERLVLDPVRLICLSAEFLATVLVVLGEVSEEPAHLRVALEGQDMGGDPVEEPTIVADDHRATGEGEKRLLE